LAAELGRLRGELLAKRVDSILGALMKQIADTDEGQDDDLPD
jgi:hypothetical protein